MNIGETKVIQASRYGTGRVSAVSESPNIVRIDSVVQTAGGADITVTGLTAGTARISASVAQTAIYRGQTVTMPVSVAVSGTSPVPYQGGTLVWNGGAQSPVWVGYDASLLTIGGTTSASDAGTYTAVFAPKAGVTWEDGTTGAKSVSWAIGKLSLAKPAQSGTLIFNGNAQSPAWSGYNGAYMAASGDTSGTNAGTYTTIFSLLDPVNCQWSDGTSGPAGANWTIGKASPNLTVVGGVSPNTNVGTALWVDIERDGNGAVTAESSNDAVATAFADLTQGIHLSIMGVSAGSCVITVRVAETENYTADSVSYPLTVTNRTVTLPTQSGTLTYTGSSQSPTWSGYDSAKMTLGGTTSGTNAGSYTATFTPKTGYQWSDGTAGAKDAPWTIGKASPNLSATPSSLSLKVGGTGTFTVTRSGGGTVSASSSSTSYATVSVSGTTVTVTAVSKGSPTITISVPETTNYTAQSITRSVSVANNTISPPTQSGTLTYTGSSQSPTWSGYDSAKMTLGGTTSGTNAGSYTATFTPKTGYQWSDGTAGAKDAPWTIGKASPNLSATPSSLSLKVGGTGTFTVTRSGGGTVSASSSSTSYATVSVSGTTVTVTAVSKGSPTITISVPETTNYTAQSITRSVSVSNNTISLPTQSGTLTYSGSSQSPTWSGYDSAKMTLGGTTSGTNAGSYTATFTPKTGYQWSDGTTGAKDASWSIGKASPNLSVPDNWGDITEGAYLLVTVLWDGDGNIGARASTGTVTVAYYDRPSGYSRNVARFKVTGVSAGSTDVIFSVSGTTNYSTQNVTRTATVTSPKALNDYTWDEISAISQAGTGDTYFDVGDVKMITLNGTVGTKTYSNVSLGVYILDFNHVDGGAADNNIIWGGFKTALTGGVDVALDDAYYGTGKADGTKAFNMSHWGNYNYGGWKGCDLRYDILGATKTAPSGYGSAPVSGRVGYDATQAAITSPLANTLMAALPSDFRNVLRLRTHYVDNVGGGTDASTNVTAVVDAISLLAEFEVFAFRTGSTVNPHERGYQKRMAYYANGGSAAKYRQSDTTAAAAQLGSSPLTTGASMFSGVSTNGGVTNTTANWVLALSPVFKT